MNNVAFFECIACGKKFPLGKFPLTCTDHNPYYGYLYINYQYDTVKQFPLENNVGWSRYLPLLPIDEFSITFQEIATPLVHAKTLGSSLGIKHLWIKDEGKNPTASFKDKETSVALNAGQEMGMKDVALVSSGNAAVSTAAYAQKAGMKCTCIVPKGLSQGKKFLLHLYGASIQSKKGQYENLYRELVDHPSAWNVTPGMNPYKDEGVKIIGFEIWEQLGVPDVIVVPCGNGTLLWGVYKAFSELKKIGKIKKLPQFVGVQIKGGDPLVKAYDEGKEIEILKTAPESIAEGIIATESYSSPKVMHALKETKGKMISVTEKQVKEALKSVIEKESLIPEPTSAAAYAGLKALGGLNNKIVVVIQTASGLKNLHDIKGVI